MCLTKKTPISTAPSDLVLLFTRAPEPGKCKTRLIPALGAEGAASIHRQLTQLVMDELIRLAPLHPHRLEIHFEGADLSQMQAWLGPGRHYRQQSPGDIGCRMQTAINLGSQQAQRLLLIGSDCPGLGAEALQQAFLALSTHDLVLGPAFDGGYYLIGATAQSAKTVCATLFHDIPWGMEAVFSLTLSRAVQQGLSCHILKPLHDIDTPADLRHLNHYPHSQ